MAKKKKKKKPTNAGDIRVLFLGWEDLLKEGMAAHFSILAWRMLLIEKHGGLQSIGLQKVRHHWSNLTLKEFRHLLKVKWEIIIRFWTED